MKLRIDLNEPQILRKVTNDRFGKFVSGEWWRLMKPYTPYETGTMWQSVKLRPWEIEYFQPYSAYMYYGELMVDPDTGSSWARKDAKKVYTGIPLKYSKPGTTDHWDIKAAETGQLNKLYTTLNDALQSDRF